MALPVDKEKVKEQRLKDVLEAGTSLLNPPSSTEDLLDLLEKSKNLMIYMEQSNSEPTKRALLPLRNALQLQELFGTSDVDVEMSVISCICEMMRITAPEPPYNDDVLKEFFHLFVPALACLSQNSTSSSYRKAAFILEIAAEVRFCVLMVDLKLEKLIIEMFQLFLKTIKSDHPDTVFKHMETIMTLIMQESDDDISLELLTPLLDSVRKNNPKTSHASWKLGEKVLINCAAILKPCIQKAVHSSVISLGDYSDIVTSICENGSTREEDRICRSGDHVTEPLGFSPQVSEIEDISIAKNSNLPEGSRRKRGRPKKNKSVFNEDGNINSSSVSKVDFLEARVKEKTLESIDISVKKEADDTSYLEGKQDSPIKDYFNMEGNLTEKSERNPFAGKEQASVLADLDEQLLGKQIKVWWPLDKKFYVGIVRSVDHKKRKHKVLYTDGEEELLDLEKECWGLIGDDVSPPEEQEANLPELDSSYIPRKRKRNRKSESGGQAKAGSSSKRGRPPKKPKVEVDSESDNPVNDGKENGEKSTGIGSKSSTLETIVVSSGAEDPETCTGSGSKPTTPDTMIASKAEDPQKSTGTSSKQTTPDTIIVPKEQEADLPKPDASSYMPQKKKLNRKSGSIAQAIAGSSSKRGRPKKSKVEVDGKGNGEKSTSTSSKAATPETVIVPAGTEDPQKSKGTGFKPTTPETSIASKGEDPQNFSGTGSRPTTPPDTVIVPKEQESDLPKLDASSYMPQKKRRNRKSGSVGQEKDGLSKKRGRPPKNPNVEVDKEPGPFTDGKGNGEKKSTGTGSKPASLDITIVSSMGEDPQRCITTDSKPTAPASAIASKAEDPQKYSGTNSKPTILDTAIVPKELEADLPKPDASSYIPQKKKRNRKPGSFGQAIDGLSRKRGRPRKIPKVEVDKEPDLVTDGKGNGEKSTGTGSKPASPEITTVSSRVEDPQNCISTGSKPTPPDSAIASKTEDPQKSNGTNSKPPTPDIVIASKEREADLTKAPYVLQEKKANKKLGLVGQAKAGSSSKRGRPPKKPKVEVDGKPDNLINDENGNLEKSAGKISEPRGD